MTTEDIAQSIIACAAHYGEQADAMRDYLTQGQERVYNLNNRGPLKLDENGDLDAGI